VFGFIVSQVLPFSILQWSHVFLNVTHVVPATVKLSQKQLFTVAILAQMKATVLRPVRLFTSLLA